MSTTATFPAHVITGDLPIRPGFASRLTSWLSQGQRAKSIEIPEFDARTRYDLGFDDIADVSKLQGMTDLEPHVVIGKMWMGVR